MEGKETDEETKLKLQFVTSDELWDKVVRYKLDSGAKNNSIAVEELIKKALDSTENKKEILSEQDIPSETLSQIKEFRKDVPTFERKNQLPISVFLDKRSGSFYSEVHLLAKDLVPLSDTEATIDPELQKEYKSNRELELNDPYFIQMVEDSKGGRQFSDLVMEYNTGYTKQKPLKILGGQHRHRAIETALKEDVNAVHGIKVYFNLTMEQRAEIMRIANTNIKVANDLRDRIEEQKLKPILREFCYETGILDKQAKEDFGAKRKFEEEFSPTVKMMRSFIIDFYKGKEFKGEIDKDAVEPEIADTGEIGVDKNYMKIFNKFEKVGKFSDEDLIEAGRAFAKLHEAQYSKADKLKISGKKQIKVKAFSDSIITAWAYAAGVLQKDKTRLKKLYDLPDLSGDTDPLNASAMNKARAKKDPDTYRGLGMRSNETERGRVLMMFLLYTLLPKTKIDVALCNAAIERYESNKGYIASENKIKDLKGNEESGQ